MEKPVFRAPEYACDSHVHILGNPQKYLFAEGNDRSTYKTAFPEDYLSLQKIMGLERVVFVQLGAYGTNNSCQLDAASYFGLKNARVVAVINENTITDRQLQDLHDKGTRGLRVRLSSSQPLLPGLAEKMLTVLQKLENLIKNTGWFLDIMFTDWLIYELYHDLKKLRVPYIFPHYGMNRACNGIGSSSFQALLSLMKDGFCWVKLSGPNRLSVHPTYADMVKLGRTIYETAPNRVLWGSDYPHTNSVGDDTIKMFNMFKSIVPDKEDIQRIMVENPAVIFDFEKT